MHVCIDNILLHGSYIGFVKSIDCPAQSINRYFAQQTSMDLLPNPWIVRSVATLHAQSSYGLSKRGFDLFWFEVTAYLRS